MNRMDASLNAADGQVCVLFAVDIAGFTRPDRDDGIRLYLHEQLYSILEVAFDRSGIPWNRCFHEDRGDGALVVIPYAASKGIIDPLPDRLRSLIRRHNRIYSEASRIQLRAAAHIGPVEHDGRGFVGSDITLLFRMLEARPLKHALADSGTDLALIVSDHVYHTMVRRHPSLVSPDVFQRVRFRVKDSSVPAWTYLPEQASPDTRHQIDQGMTAFRAALARMNADPGEAARIRNLANATDAQIAAEAKLETLARYEQMRDQTMPQIVEQLTSREREVLTHMAGMLSTAEIATEMYLSANTVKTHLRSIYRKLSATHRSEAVRRARQLKLI